MQLHEPDSPQAGWLIREMPPHETPRARLSTLGCKALSDIELLSLLIGSGSGGQSCIDVARRLYRSFDGSLTAMAAATPGELATRVGIGFARAGRIIAGIGLGTRAGHAVPDARPSVASPETVYDYCKSWAHAADKEEFHVLLLDRRCLLLRDVLVTVGLVDRSLVHAREVFRPAILANCTAVVVAHNHPSGDPTPSAQDINITRNLVEAGKVVGIEVLDHVVVGHAGEEGRARPYLSMREEGLCFGAA